MTLNMWNNEHRDLVAVNLRAKLIGLGHTPGKTEAFFLDRRITCTTCGWMAFLHGAIVASPILRLTCQEAQEKLPMVKSAPAQFRQTFNHNEFAEQPPRRKEVTE